MPYLLSRIHVLLLVLAALGPSVVPAAAQQRAEIFVSGKSQFGTDLGAGGFDSVAYHTQKQAVPGTPEFRAAWKGAEWRFASKENRDLFVANPDRYAPQFGGYCAFAVAHNTTTPADPKVWKVVNGRLYLNLNPNVQSSWERNQADFITRAEQNWPGLIRR